VVTVDLDKETCVPKIQVFAVDDVGRALNPQDVEAQVKGGVLQGIAEALWEEAKYSSDGIPTFGTIVDSGFAKAYQSPRVNTQIVEFPSTLPHGARGVGESGTIGGMAGTFLALEKVTGRKISRIPVDPREVCGS
jgi:carbon-monoxide dehydrogenase large subunit